ncbi:L,D-transpeptidase [Candidatus Margulisiibacteriota bacterium]
MKIQKITIISILLICLVVIVGYTNRIENEKEAVRLPYLRQQVLQFANKYRNQDVIVVSKKDHLLYYLRNGKLVRNEKWNGFTINFPVKVALAMPGYDTPEGEMFIDRKNPYSKYVRFLSFSGPGAYGIHSEATKYKTHMERMEKLDPNFEFATKKDNTRGCVQVENRIIKYLFSKVDVKTPVLVLR